jgi:hypothetical protein
MGSIPGATRESCQTTTLAPRHCRSPGVCARNSKAHLAETGWSPTQVGRPCTPRCNSPLLLNIPLSVLLRSCPRGRPQPRLGVLPGERAVQSYLDAESPDGAAAPGAWREETAAAAADQRAAPQMAAHVAPSERGGSLEGSSGEETSMVEGRGRGDSCGLGVSPAAVAATGPGEQQHGARKHWQMQETEDDLFSMYVFKVAQCSKQFVHDWKECPYRHDGETAGRRHPRLHAAQPCPEYKNTKSCPRGDRCHLAHGPWEAGLHPAAFRTNLCAYGGACGRRMCFFAHDSAELRHPEYAAAAGGPPQPPSHWGGAPSYALPHGGVHAPPLAHAPHARTLRAPAAGPAPLRAPQAMQSTRPAAGALSGTGGGRGGPWGGGDITRAGSGKLAQAPPPFPPFVQIGHAASLTPY